MRDRLKAINKVCTRILLGLLFVGVGIGAGVLLLRFEWIARTATCASITALITFFLYHLGAMVQAGWKSWKDR